MPDVGVSVVMATRGLRGLAWGDRRRFVIEAMRSLLAAAGHARLELVVVHDDSVPVDVLAAVRGLGAPSLRFVAAQADQDEPERRNLGVLASSHEIVVLLDEHTQPQGPDFVSRLVTPLLEDVGMTGPRVLRTDGLLLDAGLAFHGLRISPMFEGWAADEEGPEGLLATTRACSGLGQTCLALTRATFDEVGGVSERFPLLWHVDLAHKVARTGRRVVWVAEATTYQVSTPHPDPQRRTKEMIALRQRWASPEVDTFVPTYGSRSGAVRPPGPEADVSAS